MNNASLMPHIVDTCRPWLASTTPNVSLTADHWPGEPTLTLHERRCTTALSIVYMAWNTNRDMPVCIKMLHPDLAHDAASVRRFRAEIDLVSRLDHPNLPKFVASDVAANPPYYVMEWIEGKSLSEVGDELSEGQLIQVGKHICAALGHMHQVLRHIHKDMKPDNVLVREDGSAVLIDVGIAFSLDGQRHTQPGYRIGTKGYYPPNVEAGDPPTVPDELYAMGNVLREVSTHKGEQYPSGRLSKPLVRLINHLLAAAAADRPQSAAVVFDLLVKMSTTSRRKVPPARVVALGVMFAFLAFTVVAGVTIVVRTPDGTKHTVKLEGGEEIQIDGNRVTVKPAEAKRADLVAAALKNGNGKELVLHDGAITDADLLEVTKGVITLITLDLGECGSLSDGVLKVVTTNPDLRTVLLGGIPLSEDALIAIAAHLSKTPKEKKRLSASREDMSAKVVSSLASIPNLEELSVHGARVDAATCEAVSKQTGLKSLRLSSSLGGTATAADFSKLGSLTELVELNLSSSVADDSTLDRLTGLTKLVAVYLDYTRVSGRSAKVLASFHSLANLSLDSCEQFDDDGLRELSLSPRLVYLCIDKTGVTDDSIPSLKKLSRLNGLSARFTKITDKSADALSEIPALNLLFLLGCDTGDKTILALAGTKKKYNHLVTGQKVTNDGVAALATISGLHNVSLWGSDADDGCIESLGIIKTLKTLDVSRSRITPDGVKRLKKLLPGCEVHSD